MSKWPKRVGKVGNENPTADGTEMGRRSLLKVLGGAALWSQVAGPFSQGQMVADAQDGKMPQKFLLTVHCGSWDGWPSGLIQPTDVGKYPKGVFRFGAYAESPNPNVNAHFKTGNLVLNGYSKVLEPIANHVFHGMGTSQTLGHGTGEMFQQSGEGIIGAGGNPSWIAGVAQAIHGGSKASSTFCLASPDALASQMANTTPNVAVVGSLNLADFRTKFTEPERIPMAGEKAAYMDVLKGLNNGQYNSSLIDAGTSKAINSSIESLMRGVPEISDDAPVVQNARAGISRGKVDGIIQTLDDAEGIIANHKYDFALEQLQLAAILAKSGLASGLHIQLDGQDAHTGGSSVDTGRSGAQILSQLVVFWQWVKENKLQDHVMIIISHEFSRTAFNEGDGPSKIVKFRGNETMVKSPGTDHGLTMGMIFINGKVPAASRMGAIGDSYIATGSADFTGKPDPDIAPFTSMQFTGSMLMRCFGDLFPDARAVRRIWPNFSDADVIRLIAE